MVKAHWLTIDSVLFRHGEQQRQRDNGNTKALELVIARLGLLGLSANRSPLQLDSSSISPKEPVAMHEISE